MDPIQIQVVQNWIICGLGAIIGTFMILLWHSYEKINEKLGSLVSKDDCKDQHHRMVHELEKVGIECLRRHQGVRSDLEADTDDCRKRGEAILREVGDLKQKMAYANGANLGK